MLTESDAADLFVSGGIPRGTYGAPAPMGDNSGLPPVADPLIMRRGTSAASPVATDTNGITRVGATITEYVTPMMNRPTNPYTDRPSSGTSNGTAPGSQGGTPNVAPYTPATSPSTVTTLPAPTDGTVGADPALGRVLDAYMSAFSGSGNGGSAGGGGVTVSPVPITPEPDASGSSLAWKPIAILAALGAAGWFGYRYWKKHHTASAA